LSKSDKKLKRSVTCLHLRPDQNYRAVSHDLVALIASADEVLDHDGYQVRGRMKQKIARSKKQLPPNLRRIMRMLTSNRKNLMSEANSIFRRAALFGAAVAALASVTPTMAQTILPDESQRNKILVPRPDFPGAKQQEEPGQVDLGTTPRSDFPGPKQSETQQQHPSQK
jgi:hypothetical protein